jgi:peroxiredoxin
LVRLARRVTFLIDKNGVIQEIQPGGEAIDPNNALETCSLMNHRQPSATPAKKEASQP